MEYTEFKRHLGKAGLTINDYASLLHVRPSSISNYAKKGAVPQTHAIIAVILGDAGDKGSNFTELLSRFGVRPADSHSTKVTVLKAYRLTPTRRGKR